jgi:UDP-N-acetylmuramoylalanine--D-glutamate ligase
MNLQGKHITILGAARSGIAAAVLSKKRGAIPFVTDKSAIKPAYKSQLEANGIAFEELEHSERALNADFAVISPGVPSDVPLVLTFKERGIPVLSEVEFASRFITSHVVAITGTNGKTTTTTWTDYIWEKAGRKHVTGGNIGTAFAGLVEAIDAQTDVILEVSSFQLDHISTFKPNVSILLNITPDHLNRYGYKFENYIASKMRICENQTPGDYFIYTIDDPVTAAEAGRLRGRNNGPQLLAISTEGMVERGAGIKDGMITFNLNGTDEPLMYASELSLPGKHNLQNGLAAALAARVSEISNDAIRQALTSFKGVEHRLEFVRELDGVRYVNDSKATNVNSVWYALQSYADPIVLILGGQDKGNDYNEIAEFIRKRVRAVVAIGEGKKAVVEQLGAVAHDLTVCETFEEAIRTCKSKAFPGDVVLLSPACASFDMFDNYEHRGREFKRIVNAL